MPIVDFRHTRLDVVQDFRDDEARNAQARHMASGRTKQIVGHEGHTGYRYQTLGGHLRLAQRLLRVYRTGEDPWGGCWHRLPTPEQRHGWRTQGYPMGQPIFRSATWNGPPSCLQVRILPTHRPHFASALGGEEGHLKVSSI